MLENNNLQGAILHCQSAIQHIKSTTLIYGPYTTNQTLSNGTSSIIAQASESGVTAIPVVLKELCPLESRIIYNQTNYTTVSQLVDQLNKICESNDNK